MRDLYGKVGDTARGGVMGGCGMPGVTESKECVEYG